MLQVGKFMFLTVDTISSGAEAHGARMSDQGLSLIVLIVFGVRVC